MMKNILLTVALFATVVYADELEVSADYMSADRKNNAFVAEGHVQAVAHPFRLFADRAEKAGDDYFFAPGTFVTSCTNDCSCLHWRGGGQVYYHGAEGERYAVVKNMTLRLFDVPVMWFPYWYYPLDTDYGWRVMPGYMSKWGVYLLTKYVYPIAGSMERGSYGLSGATRFDVRSKNGVALGQSVSWNLGQFGQGKFKVYYAWDLDADHYDRRWISNRYNYQNWESTVPDERYSLMVNHRWEMTERDTLRVEGAYYSDTRFTSDFLRDTIFGHANRFSSYSNNEIAWEHVENVFGLGLSVSGPVNKFYGGVARLPEAYLDVSPLNVWTLGDLPLNYESSTRAGFLNRNYALLGKSTTATSFRYDPGPWADYQAFRFDTYHRLTTPFKCFDDVLSVVPRVGVRGTFYSETGAGYPEVLDGTARAGTGSENVWRSIVEGGVTFAARGHADYDHGWSHIVEPYLDVLVQKAEYHGLEDGSRPFLFDSHDFSRDWLDQFAGRSRNLPYTWYGMTPGLRNAFRHADADGRVRTIFDVDIYAAIQFNDTEWYPADSKWQTLVKDPADPNYGKDRGQVMPGMRIRWFPDEDSALSFRAEYDTENNRLAYADVSWQQIVTDKFRYGLSFVNRDHRAWDYSVTHFDSKRMTDDYFNHVRYSYLDANCEYEFCDAVVAGPFIRWDCFRDTLDEVGSFVDIRTDCLGFRFSLGYSHDYERIDGSEVKHDWRFGFYIYLRALGPSLGSPMM